VPAAADGDQHVVYVVGGGRGEEHGDPAEVLGPRPAPGERPSHGPGERDRAERAG
jgi:hypothetical protein